MTAEEDFFAGSSVTEECCLPTLDFHRELWLENDTINFPKGQLELITK